MRSIIKMLRQKYSSSGSVHTQALAVTASTGIAALNIGGETLHSFAGGHTQCFLLSLFALNYAAGAGLGKKPVEQLIDRLSQKSCERWIRVRTLIIDESRFSKLGDHDLKSDIDIP